MQVSMHEAGMIRDRLIDRYDRGRVCTQCHVDRLISHDIFGCLIKLKERSKASYSCRDPSNLRIYPSSNLTRALPPKAPPPQRRQAPTPYVARRLARPHPRSPACAQATPRPPTAVCALTSHRVETLTSHRPSPLMTAHACVIPYARTGRGAERQHGHVAHRRPPGVTQYQIKLKQSTQDSS
jgi:hypothetical protein